MKNFLIAILCAFAFQIQAQVYMYGTTYEGGANNLGTIYRVDENGLNFQKLYDFSTNTGGKPLGGLTLANGKLYGFTTQDGPVDNPGATLGLGSFFEFDPITNNLTVIESVDDKATIGIGFNHSPLLANDGKLYFASTGFGISGLESILSTYDPVSNSITILDTLTNFFGTKIQGKLMQASNNHIYAITTDGATFGYGAIIRWNTTTSTFERLHVSEGPGPSSYHYIKPDNQLLEASDGNIYGISLKGGNNTGVSGVGLFFKIGLDGTGYIGIKIFDTGIADEGYYPYGGLIEKSGIIYGTTSEEDLQNVNSGTIFSYTLSNSTFDFIHTLDLEGVRPKGTFVESPNGRFYVTTSGDPSVNFGHLIEFNPLNGAVTQKHSFGGTGGSKPYYDQLAIVDFSIISVDETTLDNLNISIFPNPVSDYLSIKNSGNYKIQKIDIYNSNGQLIYSSKPQESINLSNFEIGIYYVKLELDNNQKITKKIIKE